jgi:hypothetical protein
LKEEVIREEIHKNKTTNINFKEVTSNAPSAVVNPFKNTSPTTTKNIPSVSINAAACILFNTNLYLKFPIKLVIVIKIPKMKHIAAIASLI